MRCKAEMSFTENKKIAAYAFSKAAASYDQHAFLQREIGARLLEKVTEIVIQPKYILDLGCGTGFFTQQLQKKFPRSQIIGLDLAEGMLAYTPKKGWLSIGSLPRYLCADAEALPLKSEAFDLIFSNLTVQWCPVLLKVFTECHAALAPHGHFFFSTLGPQTLQELRDSWRSDPIEHVNTFIEMHQVGDALLRASFAHPVIDRELLSVTYSQVPTLLRDLKAIGSRATTPSRKGLTPKKKYQEMLERYQNFALDKGLLPATFEIIYGHAYKSARSPKETITRISAKKIPRLSPEGHPLPEASPTGD